MQNFWLNKQNQIQEILDNFDFNKVQSVMQHLNWKWSMGPNNYAIPTIENLVDMATQLLKDAEAASDDPFIVGCGGFEAEKSGGDLNLKFVIEG